MKLKNITQDESASTGAFVWALLVLSFIILMVIWTMLYEGAIIPLQQIALDTDALLPAGSQDPSLPIMILIVDYVPLWILIGHVIIGLSRSQKQDESNY